MLNAACENKEENGKEGKDKDIELKLLSSRIVMLFDEISKKSANEVVKRLLVLDSENKEEIKLFVNSPGGDVDAGYQIFDLIRYLRSPVKIICNGLVASAATLVLVATPKKNRISLPNSRFLIHQPSSGIQGTVSDVEIYARELEKLRKRLNGVLQEETGQSMATIDRDTSRDYWMDAEEAVKYGLISKIITHSDDL